MLKYYNYDIVFQEYPDEVTLAINLTLCPNRCVGCHSAFLRDDIGEELSPERLTALIDSLTTARLLAWAYKGATTIPKPFFNSVLTFMSTTTAAFTQVGILVALGCQRPNN